MQKTLQHIAIPAILFYVFPLFFQPLHVVFHHSSCEYEEACEYENLSENHQEPFIHQNKDCSLCDYESLISNIQKIKNQVKSPAPSAITYANKLVIAPDLINVNFNPLRAPPVL